MTHLEETLIELKKCGKSGYLVMTCLAILKDIEDYDKMIEPRQPECKDCIFLIKELIKRGLK